MIVAIVSMQAHRGLLALSLLVASALSFDLKYVKQTLGFAQVAYCSNIDTWTCGAVCDGLDTLSEISVVTDRATQGLVYVGYRNTTNTIVVSFRGTVATDFQNWWTDLSSIHLITTPLCPSKGCQVCSTRHCCPSTYHLSVTVVHSSLVCQRTLSLVVTKAVRLAQAS